MIGRADPSLVADIAIAAAREAMESILIKVAVLPMEYRVSATSIALAMISAKTQAFNKAFPAKDIAPLIAELAEIETAAIVQQLREKRFPGAPAGKP